MIIFVSLLSTVLAKAVLTSNPFYKKAKTSGMKLSAASRLHGLRCLQISTPSPAAQPRALDKRGYHTLLQERKSKKSGSREASREATTEDEAAPAKPAVGETER